MTTARQPNWRLADAMREAGMSRKGLARRVELLSVAEGMPLRCGHTDIARWLEGMRPRDPAKAAYVARILADKLGHPITPAELALLTGSDDPDDVPVPARTARAVVGTGALPVPQGWRCARTRRHLALLQPVTRTPVARTPVPDRSHTGS